MKMEYNMLLFCFMSANGLLMECSIIIEYYIGLNVNLDESLLNAWKAYLNELYRTTIAHGSLFPQWL